MGLYINGMEMPKRHNYVAITIWPNGIASYGVFDRDGILRDFKNIEAVSVPPHGDLIDRDALMDQIVHDTPLSAVFEKTMRRYLHNAPTIIPADKEET